MRFYDSYDWHIGTEMTELERDYKAWYLEGKKGELKVPHHFDASIDVPENINISEKSFFESDFLIEDMFFEENQDVGLYRHVRYLPAFWHSHSFLEIACVIQGEAVNYVGDISISMKEGDILIFAPEVKHALGVYDDESIVVNIIIRTSSFEQAFFGILSENDILAEFFRRMLYHSPNHPYLYFRAGEDHELFNFVGYALQEFQGNREYKKRMINAVVTGFFIMLLRKHGSDVILPEINSYGEDENVVFLLKYLQDNFQAVTLGELAAFFHYSERQIQRIIKEATGLSFRENILKLRMIHAVRLLQSTQLSVGKIAEHLNYESPANFRTAFKKYYGVSPSQYKKNPNVV